MNRPKGHGVSFTFPVSDEFRQWVETITPNVRVWLEVTTDSAWVQGFVIVDPDEWFGNWLVDYEKGTFAYQEPHADLLFLPQPLHIFKISYCTDEGTPS